MLETINYKFKKPELADSPPDITVMNPNWDSIDAKLKSNEEQINDLESLINKESYLYRYGVEYISITGGWFESHAGGVGVTSKGANYLYAKLNENANPTNMSARAFGCVNDIDFSEIKALFVRLATKKTPSSYEGQLRVSIGTDRSKITSNGVIGQQAFYGENITTADWDEKIISIDTTAITGSYNLDIFIRDAANNNVEVNGELKIYEVWVTR